MSFEEFIKAKQEEAKSKRAFDKDAVITRYQNYVDDFYHSLQNNWLAGYFESMQPQFNEITLHEDLLGDYTVRSLVLTIGDAQIQFKPIGTVLIGTCGRIDAICNLRKGMFILVNEKARTPRSHTMKVKSQENKTKNLVWKLVNERGMMSFIDLTPESMQQFIMEIAR